MMNVYLYFILCYFIGNLMTGYTIVKLSQNKDIRDLGSGNVGARNAGRLFGKKFFVITFLGDALKGALVIYLGQSLDYSPGVQLVGLELAVIGHILPVVLRFNGGKGVSTFIGGMLAFNPLVAVVIIGAFLIMYPFTKSFTIAGLGSLLMIPLYFYFYENTHDHAFLVFGMVIIIIIAHSKDIFERMKRDERYS
ncbi:glycerol-3-phosphate acyltransferase [Peribacillus acanthi]|uniref:glycerol-3-phosphate acyltransferase n=1 Tax=Peribacillus acanthi TaxID=2171554 RepID=UPI000D3E7D15|nr:glycerol-3-phosphate acyltransferase [Peribacillus acanthi]